MNIQEVADNLRLTIAGKEKYLAQLRKTYDQTGVRSAVAAYVELNIDELERILVDVEQCIESKVDSL